MYVSCSMFISFRLVFCCADTRIIDDDITLLPEYKFVLIQPRPSHHDLMSHLFSINSGVLTSFWIIFNHVKAITPDWILLSLFDITFAMEIELCMVLGSFHKHFYLTWKNTRAVSFNQD